MRLVTLTIVATLLTATATADVLHLKNGFTIRGSIIQEADDFVTVAMEYGTISMHRIYIASIEKTTVEELQSAASQASEPKDDARLPRWSTMVQRLANSPWAAGLTQIPATVIDKGVLRNVPYTSYRCGANGDYELNVYGDPDTPAGVEIGVYGTLTKDPGAKQRCIEFIAAVLPGAADAAILKAARLEGDKIERRGMTVETTPPTAEDAYGGWWVSVYYEHRLDQARASEKELTAITAARDVPAEPATADSGQAKRSSRASAGEVDWDWTREDLQKARPPQASTASPSTGGRVYVRGYHRKDGTYVKAHTRRRPSR